MIQIFFPSDPFDHVWPSLLSGLNKSRNLSIILRRGSASRFLSSSLFLRCTESPLSVPPLPEPVLLSDFPRLLVFCAGNSTQVGVVVLHSPRSTRHGKYLNSASVFVSTSSSDVVLHGCRNTYTFLWIQSTISAQEIRSPVKALSY